MFSGHPYRVMKSSARMAARSSHERSPQTMTDTSAQPPVKSGGRVPNTEKAMVPDRAVASWAFELILYPFDHYRQQLTTNILPHPVRFGGDSKKLRSEIARLSKPSAYSLLILVWRQPLSENDLDGSGLHPCSKQLITRHALSRVLEMSSGETADEALEQPEREKRAAKFVRSASRIVEAALTFGLLEELPAQAGPVRCKPLRGTDKLDKFMTALGVNYAVRLREAFVDGGQDLCNAAGQKGTRKGGSKK
jgi:hypothetical protein